MTSLRANLFLVALGLSLLGLVMVYSATYREPGRTTCSCAACTWCSGWLVFLVVSRIRYTAWRRYAPALYLVVLVGARAGPHPGDREPRSAARAGGSTSVPMSLQPAEFAKLAAVLVLSCAVARVPAGSGLPFKPLAAVGRALLAGAPRAGFRHLRHPARGRRRRPLGLRAQDAGPGALGRRGHSSRSSGSCCSPPTGASDS